ncbi:MAG TPA: glycoside hydrolase family 36 protein [Flavitalea sp.]|nr:glycoside hydrolase family 36 protein [Flavitalea sp.]
MQKHIIAALILVTAFCTLTAQTPLKQASKSRFIFRQRDNPGMVSMTDRLVLDEALTEGRFVTRYRNSNGQIWPEMHFDYLKLSSDEPAESFRLSINKADLSGTYEWQSAEISPDPSHWRPLTDNNGNPREVVHSTVTLLSKSAGIRVKVHTRLDGSPFMIRWLEITNLNKTVVAITDVAPLAGLLWKHRSDEHLPKEYASPFTVAYTHSFDFVHEGDFYFSELAEGKMNVNGGKTERSWGRPAFWARNRCNGQTFVCELAWGGNYEYTFDSRISDPKNASLFFSMGLSGFDEALRVLDAGETISTPSVHMALFQDNDEAIVQATHDHVRNVVMPKQIPGRHIEIEANHRGYLVDRENVADINKDIDVAKSIGAEMYVIDAGWYGNEPNNWFNNVGDWRDGKWMEKGGGLKAISEYAHKKNMKFGLWIEVEAAGTNSTLKKEYPEWLLTRDGQPIVNGRALNIIMPEVMQFEKETIQRYVRDLKLDMYRIDHNHNIFPSPNRLYKGFKEDLMWRYFENFYKMFDSLRAEFPDLVFQNCAGGGGRLDWGTMSRFHNTELSDFMRLPRGIKILNGVSMSLPPEILLRTFGTEVGEHTLDGDLESQLRHTFSRIIFRGIAPSLEELTPYMKTKIINYIKIYNEVIRPTMIGGKVFHHTPFLPLLKTSPWCVLEYAKPDRSTSVSAIFRTSAEKSGSDPDKYVFYPRGIDPSKKYKVQLDSQMLSYEAAGELLIREGISIRLERPLASEMIILQSIGSK